VQHTATHRNTLQHTATLCNTLQHTASHCNMLQHTMYHTATDTYTFEIKRRCSILQHTATHCNTLQHTATHCNTLQHTAPHTVPHCNKTHTHLKSSGGGGLPCCPLHFLTKVCMNDGALAGDDDGSWASMCAFGCVCVSTGIPGVCSGGVCGE